ncbi:AMP binding protein [Infundibulicybe gibba]|nr:AMP binding protein [Infundibulicybe gibba]
MAPRIYTSPIPPVPIINQSIFTYLFSSPDGPNNIGGVPGTTPAFVDAASSTTLTRAQLKASALALAWGLRNHPNTSVKRGDTLLIYSQNSLHWPVVLFGSVAAGLRCTLANSAYNARELAFQYIDSGSRLVFTSEDGVNAVREMFSGLGVNNEEADRRIVVLGNGLEWAGGPAAPKKQDCHGLLRVEDLLNIGTLNEEEKFDGDRAHETVYLCYSSGFTTHHNLTSVLPMVRSKFPSFKIGANNMLGILPFYHIYGAVKLLHFPFFCGSPVIIQPRFDPVQFCANVEAYRIAVALIVPPVLVVLARHEAPAVEKYDMSTLTTLFSGAAPLGAALVRQVTSRLLSKRKNNNPLRILQGRRRKVGSIGILLPNLEARLLVDGEGNGDIDAAEGEPGELWIRGPTIMKGYLNNPTATEDAITNDGWFKTGDIAKRDEEGYYWIVDRRKELIKYKKTNLFLLVPPAELESVLLTHPDVADVAVIGVESAREATELPRAYVVHAQPGALETAADKIAFQESIRRWTETKVARHKYLRGGVMVIDIVPKSAAGKILRRELRDLARKELNGRDPASEEFKAKL